MLSVGDRIGSYEIVAQLRHGGMASLFLGRVRGAAGFTRHVAIKVVHAHLASDPTFVRMFVAEAKLSARIQHPNVVHVEELGEADGSYFLVMEYVHGCAVSELLRGLARRGLRMRPDVAAGIAAEVAAGLHAAHETRGEDGALLGVVHRDVSPQNILISSTGHVKLIDFGVAKATATGQRTATGTLKGKLSYMPPEQAFGRSIDRRADIYALGVVLWEMLTGRRLFRADNDFALLDMVRDPKILPPSMIAPEVPPALDVAVMAALDKDPGARPATAEEFRQRIADAVPEATRLPPTALTDLVRSAANDVLEKRRELLPESMSGLVLAPVGDAPTALRDLTISSPSLRSGDEPPEDRSEDPTSAARIGPIPRPVPAPRPTRSRRSLALGAAAVLAVAGAAIGVVAWSSTSADSDDQPTAPLASQPPETVDMPDVEEPPPDPEPEAAPPDEGDGLDVASAADAGTAEVEDRTDRRARTRGQRTRRATRMRRVRDTGSAGAGPILAGEDDF